MTILLLRLIETDVFQLPQLHKHFNVSGNFSELLIMNRTAIISFVIFLIIGTKVILINRFGLFNPYGRENRLISWFLIMPLVIVGLLLSVSSIKKQWTSKGNILNVNTFLVLPMLLYSLWFVGLLLLTLVGIS
jgi:hypothetical protein